MSPLTELTNIRQMPQEPSRRWFTNADLELIVWLDSIGAAVRSNFVMTKHRRNARLREHLLPRSRMIKLKLVRASAAT